MALSPNAKCLKCIEMPGKYSTISYYFQYAVCTRAFEAFGTWKGDVIRSSPPFRYVFGRIAPQTDNRAEVLVQMRAVRGYRHSCRGGGVTPVGVIDAVGRDAADPLLQRDLR